MKRSFIIWALVLAVFSLLFTVATAPAASAESLYESHVAVDETQCLFDWPDGRVEVLVTFYRGDAVNVIENEGGIQPGWTLIGVDDPDNWGRQTCRIPSDAISNVQDDIPEDSGNVNEGGEQVITEAPAPADVPEDDCVANPGEDCPGMGIIDPTPESSEIPAAPAETPISEEIPVEPAELPVPEETDEATSTVPSVNMGGKEVNKLPGTGSGPVLDLEQGPWWVPLALLLVLGGCLCGALCAWIGSAGLIEFRKEINAAFRRISSRINNAWLTIYGLASGMRSLYSEDSRRRNHEA